MSQGIWFVYRSHRDGPLGKRVRRVDAPSILAWFQAKIEDARTSVAPRDVAAADLGGPVLGLGALFEAAKKHSLHTPKSSAALGKLLQEHAHADGGTDNVRVDAHSVRVFTNDEHSELAWFFFDDEALRKSTRQLAYLLHDEPSLPDGETDLPFAAAPMHPLTPAGEGEGTTYACLLTFYDRHSIPGRAASFPGVRLPGLAAHLLHVTPSAAKDGLEAWPVELRLLRAMLEEGDTTIAAALKRSAAYPLTAVVKKGAAATLGAGPHDEARTELAAAADGLSHDGDPDRSIVFEGPHAAMLAVHTSNALGFQQWIFFDDRWAAANADLATSLLHYAEHADPFAPIRAARVPATAKAPAKTKAPRAKREKGAPTKASIAKDEQAWKAAIGDREPASARDYKPSVKLDTGLLVSHAKFGVGVVTRTESTKAEVLFRDGPRLLVHSATI